MHAVLACLDVVHSGRANPNWQGSSTVFLVPSMHKAIEVLIRQGLDRWPVGFWGIVVWQGDPGHTEQLLGCLRLCGGLGTYLRLPYYWSGRAATFSHLNSTI